MAKKKSSGIILLDGLYSEAKKELEKERIELDKFVRETLKTRPLSYSSLKNFCISPKHYIEYLTAERKPDTEALIQGKVFDILLLTPDDYEKSIYVVNFEHSGRTNLGKAEREKAYTEAGGRLMIEQDVLYTTIAMIKSFFRDADAMYYFEKMKYKQVKIEWTDRGKERTGLKSVGFLDGESDKESQDYFIADIKTGRSAETDQFIRDAYNFGYHLQVGGYTLGAKNEYYKFPDFVHLVIESTAPYAVNVFRASSKYIEDSQEEYLAALTAFKYCLDNNEWHKGHAFKRFDNVKYQQMQLPGYWKPKFG
jgi:hypothetical protein